MKESETKKTFLVRPSAAMGILNYETREIARKSKVPATAFFAAFRVFRSFKKRPSRSDAKFKPNWLSNPVSE